MRFLLVLCFAAMAYAGTILPNENLIEVHAMSDKIDEHVQELLADSEGDIDLLADANEEGNMEIAPQFIISWQIRRFIRKLQKQMPCGWEQYGIPPLAPLKVSEADVHFEKGLLETFDEVFRFRIDGLDDFKINKLKLNMIFSRVTFDFTFKNIQASAQKYETDTIINALQQLGLHVEYEGDGSLQFGLQKLRIAGVLKYKIPILWGSIKITSLKTTVSVQSCNSEITGFLGEGPINRMVNRQFENFIVTGINDNQAEISDTIENNLVPRVNALLKGNNFWTLIDYIFSSSEGEHEDDPIVSTCVPPADPWAKA